jgi:nitroreductase
MLHLNLSADQVLTTTRSVRKRLDFSRPVEEEVLRECLEIAVQAPSGSNSQQWQFVIVTDAEKRKRLADLYKESFTAYYKQVIASGRNQKLERSRLATQIRIGESSNYLAEHLHEVPVFLIPCIAGRFEGVPAAMQAGAWGSILPATWSFMLAARERGLGTAWTTLHLVYEKEAAEILEIPFEKFTQAALIPVAYTIGTDFKAGAREPLDKIVHWNKFSVPSNGS